MLCTCGHGRVNHDMAREFHEGSACFMCGCGGFNRSFDDALDDARKSVRKTFLDITGHVLREEQVEQAARGVAEAIMRVWSCK